jgi:hypothetical protein
MVKLSDFPPQSKEDQLKLKKALSKFGRDFKEKYKMDTIDIKFPAIGDIGLTNFDSKEYSNDIIIFFSKDGDLYRKPREKYHYFLKETKLEIFKVLKQRLTTTEIIRESVGSISNQSVRKTIGEMNDRIGYALKLPKKQKLIESKPPLGYRINSYYLIKRVKY